MDNEFDRGYEAGRTAGHKLAYLEAEVDSHEKRLNKINGSIDRSNTRIAAQTQEIAGLRQQLGDFLVEWRKRDEIDAVRDQMLDEAKEKAEQARKRLVRAAALFVVPILAVVIGAILNNALAHVF